MYRTKDEVWSAYHQGRYRWVPSVVKPEYHITLMNGNGDLFIMPYTDISIYTKTSVALVKWKE